MIDIHERFDVPSDPRTVWAVVSDPEAVVGCVPGASLGERHDNGAFDAGAAVKFGPVNVTFRAQVTLEVDDATMVGHVTARGRDNQGGARITSTMTFHVTRADASGSTVAIDGQVEIAGRLAGVIEAGAPIVVQRMSREFAQNLAKRCAEAAASTSASTQHGEAAAPPPGNGQWESHR
jgi:carbon monoxide dehydrogenase subunit G